MSDASAFEVEMLQFPHMPGLGRRPDIIKPIVSGYLLDDRLRCEVARLKLEQVDRFRALVLELQKDNWNGANGAIKAAVKSLENANYSDAMLTYMIEPDMVSAATMIRAVASMIMLAFRAFAAENPQEVADPVVSGLHVPTMTAMIVEATFDVQTQRCSSRSRALLSSAVYKVDVDTILEMRPGEDAAAHKIRQLEASNDQLKKERDDAISLARKHKAEEEAKQTRIKDKDMRIDEVETLLRISQNECEMANRCMKDEQSKVKNLRSSGGASAEELRAAEAKYDAELVKSEGEHKIFEGEQKIALAEHKESKLKHRLDEMKVKVEARTQIMDAECEKKNKAVKYEAEQRISAMEAKLEKDKHAVEEQKQAVGKERKMMNDAMEKAVKTAVEKALEQQADEMDRLDTAVADSWVRETEMLEEIHDLKSKLANRTYNCAVATDIAQSFKELYLELRQQQQDDEESLEMF